MSSMSPPPTCKVNNLNMKMISIHIPIFINMEIEVCLKIVDFYLDVNVNSALYKIPLHITTSNSKNQTLSLRSGSKKMDFELKL